MLQERYIFLKSTSRFSKPVAQAIFAAALVMARKGLTREQIKGATFEGLVTTEGKRVSLGFISGFQFKASVEQDHHDQPAEISIVVQDWVLVAEGIDPYQVDWMPGNTIEADDPRAQNASSN